MEPGLRTKLLTAVTLALVFVSGGVTGYALAAREGDAAEAPDGARRGYVFEQFDRSPEQQAQIDSILRAHRKPMAELNAELEAVRMRVQVASDSLSRATGEAISTVFPPEVAAEYLGRLEERRAERMRAREVAEREPRDGSRR
jgi:Spy/CpxP family protein refolding chaperone